MRIIITGGGGRTDIAPIREAIENLVGDTDPSDVTIVHGGTRGAEDLSGIVARALGYNEEEYPNLWDVHGSDAPWVRNSFMVNRGANHCLAFMTPESKITRDCVYKVWAADIPVTMFYEE